VGFRPTLCFDLCRTALCLWRLSLAISLPCVAYGDCITRRHKADVTQSRKPHRKPVSRILGLKCSMNRSDPRHFGPTLLDRSVLGPYFPKYHGFEVSGYLIGRVFILRPNLIRAKPGMYLAVLFTNRVKKTEQFLPGW